MGIKMTLKTSSKHYKGYQIDYNNSIYRVTKYSRPHKAFIVYYANCSLALLKTNIDKELTK